MTPWKNSRMMHTAHPRIRKMARQKAKWDDANYLKAARLAKSGLDDKSIASALGMTPAVFAGHVRRREALRSALEEARARRAGTFREFVMGRLPPEAMRLWARLEKLGQMLDGPEKPRAAAECAAMLDEAPVRVRMHLFVQALVANNFVQGAALRMLGMAATELEGWRRQDPAFRALLAGVLEAKRDFFELCLTNLCARGDASAIVFANRTLNRDRGYCEKTVVQVETKSTLDVKVTLEDLSVEARRELLEATRRKRAEALEYGGDVPDAEFEEVRA